MTSKTLSLSESFGHIERYLGKQWRTEEEAQWALQMSFNEYDYMQAALEFEPVRLSDLAECMQVSKASASQMVRKLEGRGLLKRTPSEEDRRSVLIQVTLQGRELLALEHKIYERISEKISKQLSSEEFRTLESLLSRACESL